MRAESFTPKLAPARSGAARGEVRDRLDAPLDDPTSRRLEGSPDAGRGMPGWTRSSPAPRPRCKAYQEHGQLVERARRAAET